MAWHPPDLRGKIALVAGATRGTGRGIAEALGEAGATVYCTGRTTRAARSPMDRPETIEDAAASVTALGGSGIARRVDHTVADEVRALMEEIRRGPGRLDILVNDLWGGDALIGWGKAFHEEDPGVQWRVVQNCLQGHLVTANLAAPLLAAAGGTVVEITDGDDLHHRGHLVYDLVKTTLIRLAFDLDVEGRRSGYRAVAVTPGFLRSEAMLDHFGVTEATWRDGARKDPNFLASETPRFVGRGIACMLADADLGGQAGKATSSWELSDRYGTVDVDGARPHWGRHIRAAYPDVSPRPIDYEAWRPLFPWAA